MYSRDDRAEIISQIIGRVKEDGIRKTISEQVTHYHVDLQGCTVTVLDSDMVYDGTKMPLSVELSYSIDAKICVPFSSKRIYIGTKDGLVSTGYKREGRQRLERERILKTDKEAFDLLLMYVHRELMTSPAKD